MTLINLGTMKTRCRSIGIMGYGHFGAFLYLLLSQYLGDIHVCIYAPEKTPDGVLFCTLEETAKCDVVVLAVPIDSFETALLQLLPHLGAQSIIVDVSTVKKYTEELLKKHAKGHAWIASHPMFGAESFQKRGGRIEGLTVAVTANTLPAKQFKAFRSVLEAVGLNVVELTAHEHDWFLASTLFVTHYFGQVMNFAGFARTKIDTVSFGLLMGAVDSVKNDTKLFLDVYRFNPLCKEALKRIERGVHEVHTMLAGVA